MSTIVPLESIEIKFAGTKQQQAVAKAVLDVMRARARFMSADAAIRVTADSLVAFLEQAGHTVAPDEIEAIAKRNSAVFLVEEIDGLNVVVTTRAGRPPRDRLSDGAHSFTDRFMKPLPKPEQPPQPVRERPRVDPSWASLDQLLGDLDFGDEPAMADESENLPIELPVEIVEAEAEIEAEPDEVEMTVARTITVATASGTDVRGVDDVDLAAAIAERLNNDIRVAGFGEQWMLEDRVPRFSRGDLRRLKDYIQEQEQPLTDDVLVQDVLQVRPGAPDFDLMRFGINFRLSREHREFDFVGTSNQRFWSTTNLPPIGTTRRKPNEIGTDYRSLLEVLPTAPAYRTQKSLDHVLTFYEYHLGLLPYDKEMQSLLGAPLLPGQRSAVLTFECPQSYTTYLVELRFPTPNRGGFILGLDDFFTENLVPGALISISSTDNDGHYMVEYLAGGNQNARLLELEERRQRYVFRPTTYACTVADEYLLTEVRFPRLANEKPLDDKVRRRAEAVIAATFERIGEENEGHGYSAHFTDLMAAVNIERPFTERLLRSTLEQDETGAFARDPDRDDVYTYVPSTTS
ncbi:MAG: hypothetical protein ACRDJW_16975 [Thermomicrobiales bacterium]